MLYILKRHAGIIIPLFFIMFLNGFGQTFLIAQFNPFIQSGLGLTRTEISTVYSLATFLAGLNLTFIGGLFDRVKTLNFAFAVMILVASGLGLLSLAQNIVMLFFGFYLLRGFGQVPLGLMATTTVSKYFGKNRGKALTLIGFGRPASEGLLPPIVILLITNFGWRISFDILLISFLICFIPIIIWFIPNFPTRPIYEESKEINGQEVSYQRQVWNWVSVIKSGWPLLIMITNSLFAFAYTGLFFEQASIAKHKEWDMVIIASAFTMFSLFQIFGNLLWGPLIDKVGALKLQRLTMIPFILSIGSLYLIRAEFGAFLYLAFAGISIGFNGMVANTFWAETYGITNLGKIKGMNSKISVISTSLAPVLFARFLDRGGKIDQILAVLLLLGLIGFINHLLIFHKFSRDFSRECLAK